MKRHNTAIVSDCGAPFGFKVSQVPLLTYSRYITVVQKQVGSLRKSQLFSLINDGSRDQELDPPGNLHSGRTKLRRGGYRGLSSDVEGYQATPRDGWSGYSKDLVKGKFGDIRTDLDGFTTGEQAVLENHGYALTDVGLRKHLAGLGDDEAAFKVPNPQWCEEGKVARALKFSSWRVWPPRWFGQG